MHPPGLFPDPSAPARSKGSWVLAAVVFTALLALLGALLQIRRLARERDEAIESLVHLRKRTAEMPPKPVEASPPVAEPAPGVAPPPPAPPTPGPVRPSELRVVPARPQDSQHVAQGLHEFRAGRYDQAE